MVFQFFARRLVGHAEREHDSSLHQAPVVADTAAEQVRVGDDDLFAAEASQPRALDADLLHRPHELPDDDEVPDDERTVQCDRQRCEQIAEHVLQGESYRDPADSQASDQRGDVYPEVIEGQQHDQVPDHDAE